MDYSWQNEGEIHLMPFFLFFAFSGILLFDFTLHQVGTHWRERKILNNWNWLHYGGLLDGRINNIFFMVRILTFSLTHTQKVGMTVVSIPLMDKTGRRTLHLYGLGGMFIFSIFITISFLIKASAFDCFSYFFLLSFDSIIFGTIFFLQSVVVAARKFVEAQFTANLHVGWRKLNDFSTFLSVFFRLSHVHCSIRCEWFRTTVDNSSTFRASYNILLLRH